jgi:hypothetical protein
MMRLRGLLTALGGLSIALPASAEGVALGFVPSGAALFWTLVAPLLGALVLCVAMLATEGLRGQLAKALILCGIVAVTVFAAGMSSMSNGGAVVWLIALAFTPWLLFAVCLGCYVSGKRRLARPPARARDA